jgi:hypothetical protein
MAFIANEDGVSRLYLMNPRTREYRVVDSMPTGVALGLEFSPDGSKLAMTLNMPRAPSDAYALRLSRDPLKYGRLMRWTKSETGGIKTRLYDHLPDVGCKARSGRHPARPTRASTMGFGVKMRSGT